MFIHEIDHCTAFGPCMFMHDSKAWVPTSLGQQFLYKSTAGPRTVSLCINYLVPEREGNMVVASQAQIKCSWLHCHKECGVSCWGSEATSVFEYNHSLGTAVQHPCACMHVSAAAAPQDFRHNQVIRLSKRQIFPKHDERAELIVSSLSSNTS